MRKVFSWFLIVFLAVSLVNPIMVKADKVTMTEVAEYALSWDGNTNIPYVYGTEAAGARGRTLSSLEEVESKNKEGGKVYGIDCSAFTSLVYRHFGISIPAQSGEQYRAAKKVFSNIDEAVPGDIVWWEGHVGIYLGSNKIVHTNTSDPSAGATYPHVSIISGEGANYRYPDMFLRMVDDVSELKPMSGSSSSEATKKVESAKATGSMVTESDLTGLVIEETLTEGLNSLPEITELSDKEKLVLEEISSDIKNRHAGLFDTLKVIVSFLGLLTILYGVLLGIAYLFDRTNNILEISLLGILTLGRYRLWEEELGIGPGYYKAEGKMYCDSSVIIKRVVIIEVVGFFLVGGIGRFF